MTASITLTKMCQLLGVTPTEKQHVTLTNLLAEVGDSGGDAARIAIVIAVLAQSSSPPKPQVDTATAAQVKALASQVATYADATKDVLQNVAKVNKSITAKLTAISIAPLTRPAAHVAIGAGLLMAGLLIGLAINRPASSPQSQAEPQEVQLVEAQLSESQVRSIKTFAAVVDCQQRGKFYVFRPDRDLGAGGCYDRP